MKKLLLGAILLFSMLSLESCSTESTDGSDCEWVDGYTKANGTYVNGYWRNCK